MTDPLQAKSSPADWFFSDKPNPALCCFSFLDGHELLNVAPVSRKFCELSQSPVLWKQQERFKAFFLECAEEITGFKEVVVKGPLDAQQFKKITQTVYRVSMRARRRGAQREGAVTWPLNVCLNVRMLELLAISRVEIYPHEVRAVIEGAPSFDTWRQVLTYGQLAPPVDLLWQFMESAPLQESLPLMSKLLQHPQVKVQNPMQPTLGRQRCEGQQARPWFLPTGFSPNFLHDVVRAGQNNKPVVVPAACLALLQEQTGAKPLPGNEYSPSTFAVGVRQQRKDLLEFIDLMLRLGEVSTPSVILAFLQGCAPFSSFQRLPAEKQNALLDTVRGGLDRLLPKASLGEDAPNAISCLLHGSYFGIEILSRLVQVIDVKSLDSRLAYAIMGCGTPYPSTEAARLLLDAGWKPNTVEMRQLLERRLAEREPDLLQRLKTLLFKE